MAPTLGSYGIPMVIGGGGDGGGGEEERKAFGP